MKNIFITITTLLFSLSAFAGETHFICSNSPVAKWGTYICAYGDISQDGKTIVNMIFGTCEGSQSAQEEEPVETFEFETLQHNPALAAKSAQWKQAGAFDVSSEIGRAVFYYVPGAPVARVKLNDQDIRLNCN